MTTICDLSQDEIEEILVRVPITSRKTARSTCKRWNLLFDDKSFTKKHCAKASAKERMAIMLYDGTAYLMMVNHHNHKDLVAPSIKETCNFSSRINQICGVCDGLVLCILDDYSKGLVVWNPYLGQVRWIEPIHDFLGIDMYAIGYDKDNNHKILRFFNRFGAMHQSVDYEIYSFKSNSWKVLRDTFNWYRVDSSRNSVSLKGNTYFMVYDRPTGSLSSFDFTKERFGPPLDLPFSYSRGDHLILSTVREEQLAVVCKRGARNEIEIWITTKVEPAALSWITFLKVAMYQPTREFWFTFFVDEKKKAAIAMITHVDSNYWKFNKAYLIGEDRNYKVADLGKTEYCPFGCSYVPSSVQIE